MKAIIAPRYGTPDVLRLEDVPRPRPKDGELLVRVQVASLNATDMEMLSGKPYFIRLGGIRAPAARILGSDIAGTVEDVGPSATTFRPGDVVFGDLSDCGFGAFAEYVCARADAVALKPPALTLEDAAALAQAGVLALQGLRDHRPVQAGDRVLINGAGGGVGTFAVQMAKAAGAEVTAVDSAAKLNLLRSLGADHVIDYAGEDFTRDGRRYDLILDTVARHGMSDYRRALSDDGAYVLVGGSTKALLGVAAAGARSSGEGQQRLKLLIGRRNPTDLLAVAEMVTTGQVTPVIGGRYGLSDVPDAFRQLRAAKALGKLLIVVESGSAGR